MSAEPCRPIPFMDQLVRRILAGEKTQTRRLLSPQPGPMCSHVEPFRGEGGGWIAGDNSGRVFQAPYREGGRLWVRESYEFLPRSMEAFAARGPNAFPIRYLADGARQWVTLTDPELAKLRARKTAHTKAQPGRFLYKSCARLFLKVESVRVQRLQDIGEEDARAEGVQPYTGLGADQRVPGPGFNGALLADQPHRLPFADLWDEVNGKRAGASWESNPWAWAVSFSVDQVLVRGEGRAA